MSEAIVIKAKIRQGKGKGAARKLRAQGWIPGNLIAKTGCTMVEIEGKDLSKAWQAGKQFQMELNGQTKLVKIQELQIHAAKRQAVHVDLMYL